MGDDGGIEAFRQRILRRTGEQGFIKLVGATIEELRSGFCSVTIPFRPELMQLHGFFHGGVVGFACDYACAVAAATMLRDHTTQSVLTAEFKVNFLSPATGPVLLCRAEVVRPGRTLSVVEGRLYNAGEGVPEKLVAIGLATIATVTVPPLQTADSASAG